MGKGSAPRPFDVSEEEFAANFERIFGKKKTSEQESGKKDEKPLEQELKDQA